MAPTFSSPASYEMMASPLSHDGIYSDTTVRNRSSARMSDEPILLDIHHDSGIAVITLNLPEKFNALSGELYIRLAELLRKVATRKDVYITVLTGKGTYFSSGADVAAAQFSPTPGTPEADEPERLYHLKKLVATNADLSKALYEHPKVLVAALNGPAIGILGWFDFIYAVESAWILTPFTRLSLTAEGGSSQTFPIRMGLAKANEGMCSLACRLPPPLALPSVRLHRLTHNVTFLALAFDKPSQGKKLGSAELQTCGFVNKIFPNQPSEAFVGSVLSYLQDKYAEIDRESVLVTRELIRSQLPPPDGVNFREITKLVERFATGRPAEAFARLRNKQLRHKL